MTRKCPTATSSSVSKTLRMALASNLLLRSPAAASRRSSPRPWIKLLRPMRLAGVLFFVAFVASSTLAHAQSAERKIASAIRVANGSIRVDGRLDDEIWQKATPITDFIQKEPTEGAAPTDPMEVRLAYDDDALYVGARMFSRDGRIQAPIGRRERADQAEHILVAFDTFLDRRTAVVFGVTAAGVRIDRYHASDSEDSFDSGFDRSEERRVGKEGRCRG